MEAAHQRVSYMATISHRAVERNRVFDNSWRKALLAVAFFLSSDAIVQAGVIGKVTLVKDPGAGNNFNAPEAALPPGWVAFQLSIQGTEGDVIGAVDVSITGNALHQRWVDTDFDGVENPTPIGLASDGRGDSHLTPPAGSPFGFGPTETNTGTGSPLASTPGTTLYGLGDLAGAWAILNPTMNNNIAYIVLRPDSVPNLRVVVKSATPDGRALPTQYFVEPEPSTITLAGLGMIGGLGVIRRRLS